VPSFPGLPDYRRLLALAQERLGELLSATGKIQEADQILRRVRPLLDKLAAEFPAFPEYRRELARHHHAVGVLRTRMALPAEAEQAFRQERTLREKLAADFTEEIDFPLDLAYLLANCPEAKLREPHRAAELATKASTANPRNDRAWTVLGLAHYRTGAWKEAVKALDEAEALAGNDVGRSFVLALAHWQLGNKLHFLRIP
jgi:tetratricopeptide (TPR) repeat protein